MNRKTVEAEREQRFAIEYLREQGVTRVEYCTPFGKGYVHDVVVVHINTPPPFEVEEYFDFGRGEFTSAGYMPSPAE